MGDFWEKLREDFPVCKKYIYLDHAAGGVIAKPVQQKAAEHYKSLVEEGDFAWPGWLKEREHVREVAARFIGAEPEEITFTDSTSMGMNAISDLLVSEGDVLTNSLEFPTSTYPWLWRSANMHFQEGRGGRVDLAEMQQHLNPEIRTLVTSFVQYKTGFKQDLEALGRLKGDRYLVVNATQGFGAFPINVKNANIDFLCTNSYKWLLAGYGGGILYIKKKWLDKFKPGSVGWRSVKNPDLMDNRHLEIREDAGRYEMGCPSFSTIFNVGAAIEYLTSIGIEKISERILDLTGYAIKKLKEKKIKVLTPEEKEHRSGIVVFELDHADVVWKKLIQKGIFVSPRGGGLRLAPHFYNSFEDIDNLIREIS